MKTGSLVTFLVAGFTLCLFAGTDSTIRGKAAVAVSSAAVAAAPVPDIVTPVCPNPSGPLRIAHPCEGTRLPYMGSTFVFGSADPRGKLTVNGKPVTIHPGGGFIAMVKLSTGTCLINAELVVDSAAYAVTRAITVAPPAAASPVSPVTIEYIRPDIDWEVLPGDEIVVSCKGSPGMDAFFEVDKVTTRFPLLETAGEPGGIYRGTYVVGPDDKPHKSRIRVTLAARNGKDKATKKSEHSISLFKNVLPVMAEVAGENAILRAGPGLSADDKAGYMLFLPKGTVVQITGSRGDELRIRLNKTRDAWAGRSDLKLLPEGTPSSHVTAENMIVSGDSRSTKIRVPLGRKVPFDVVPDEEGKAIDVFLFGAVSNTDWINYVSSGAVEQVRWFQADSDTYRLHVLTGKRWWGYDARYEGNTFVLELRCPPPAADGNTPLEGITIAVDPGHSPDTGAVGPTGLMEKDANLAIACCLRDKLAAKGAKVIMTRSGSEAVPLYDRPKIAWQAKADILVSVHNNALPDGENPFEKNGYGVYYYQPLSLPLAKEIHNAYAEWVGLGNATKMKLCDDGLYYGNLALPRTTQMPSVLTESAYIIIPREEAFLKSAAFQGRIADAITAGVVRYVREIQKQPLSEVARHKVKIQRKKAGKR